MAPSFVLLERDIYFSLDEAFSGGGSIGYPWPWEGRDRPKSRQEMSDIVTDYLRTFKPHAVVADPPELSILDIRRPKFARLPALLYDLTWGSISSADKNLVALYAGQYRPGSRLTGGYLIYDAMKDSFSAIPELPSGYSHRAIGPQSAVVMCQSTGDDYVLAELVGFWPGGSKAALWLWKSSAQKWILQPVPLPLPSTTNHDFSADLCFSYRGSILCWVDLLQGVVLCDLDQDCKFSFIPLPRDCPTYDVRSPKYRHSSAEEFRSIACVCGNIKFVALDECVEDKPVKELELTVWTLSPDLSGWNISIKYNVENIWANEAYQPIGIRKLAPLFPVLSIDEDSVIYLVLYDLWGVDLGPRFIGQSLLRVDMDNNKVQFYPRSANNIICSPLFASEFSAHRQRFQDHPREMEGSEFGASGKRMKT